MRKVLFLFALLCLPSTAMAIPDLQLRAQDIRFADDPIAGEEARVYAIVRNVGTEDMTGYVLFRVGGKNMGTSQVVTVVAGGADEEVWVDFVVPDGDFNVYAELRGTDPQDEQTSNDYALSPLFTPVADGDGDGIEDDEDNCPEKSNSNQQDTDGDGLGDVCDADDDNDGLNDDVEEELGTDTDDVDTDDDGVNDREDAFPLDEERFEVEALEEVVESEQEETLEDQSPDSTSAEPVMEQEQETSVTEEQRDEEDADSEEPQTEPTTEITAVEQSAFTFTRTSWNRFTFDSQVNKEDYLSVAWDFGDGVTSAQVTGEHRYRRAGTYTVTLTLMSRDRYETVQQQEVFISPFHLGNPVVGWSVGVLTLVLLGATGVIVRIQQVADKEKKSRKRGVKKKK